MSSEALFTGVATADITPPVGVSMGGYWGRRSGAVAVHDALWARALTWRHGSVKAGLVVLDLVGLDSTVVGRMRERVSSTCGIPPEALMVCCTHTHSGPLTLPFRGMGEISAAYMERLEDTVVEVVAKALQAAIPTRLEYARAPVQIGINRRQWNGREVVLGQDDSGPVPAYVHVVHFRRSGGRDVVLFEHACHGVVLGEDNCRISADFPGAAVGHVERHTRATAVFVNGACGDVNPRITHADFAAAEALGGALGAAVVRGIGQARPVSAAGLRYASIRVELPLLPLPSRCRLLMDLAAARIKGRLRALPGLRDAVARRIQAAQADWAREALRSVEDAAVERLGRSFEVQALGIGSVVLLGMEGEIFARYQLDLERESPWKHTILCGYANGCVGYVPTADAYVRGGYEVERAFRVYPTVQMIAPQSERVVREGARRVLAALRA